MNKNNTIFIHFNICSFSDDGSRLSRLNVAPTDELF